MVSLIPGLSTSWWLLEQHKGLCVSGRGWGAGSLSGAVQELCGHSAEQALCTHAGTGHLLFLGVRSRMDPQPSTFPASPDLLPHTRFPVPLEERWGVRFPCEPCKLHFLLESISEPSRWVIHPKYSALLEHGACVRASVHPWGKGLRNWLPRLLSISPAQRKSGVLALEGGGVVMCSLPF